MLPVNVASSADPAVYEKLRLQGQIIAQLQSSKVDWTKLEERLKKLWDDVEGQNTELKEQLMNILHIVKKQTGDLEEVQAKIETKVDREELLAMAHFLQQLIADTQRNPLAADSRDSRRLSTPGLQVQQGGPHVSAQRGEQYWADRKSVV